MKTARAFRSAPRNVTVVAGAKAGAASINDLRADHKASSGHRVDNDVASSVRK